MDTRLAGRSLHVSLGDENLRSLIIRLAIPSIVGLGANALHHVVNAAFVGTLGVEAVAAVSITFPLVILLAALGTGIGVGAASLISRRLGSKNLLGASVAASTSIALVIPIGIVASMVLSWQLEGLLRAFGATDTVLPYAIEYSRWLLLGYTLMLLNIVCGFIVRAEGNSRFSMWTMIVAFGLNTVLDPIFIFLWGLGVAGAGVATLISQVVAVMVYVAYFLRRGGIVRVLLQRVQPTRELLVDILTIGAPASFGQALSAVAFVVIYNIAATFGDATVAGAGIALRLLTVGALPITGLCLGAQAVLGYAWGALDHARVRSALWFMVTVTSLFAVLYSAIMVVWADEVVIAFTSDPAAQAIAARACVAFHIFFGTFGLQAVVAAYLQSIGKARLAAVVILSRQGYLLLPLALFLSSFWGLSGLLASQALAEVLAGLIATFVFSRQLSELKQTGRSA